MDSPSDASFFIGWIDIQNEIPKMYTKVEVLLLSEQSIATACVVFAHATKDALFMQWKINMLQQINCNEIVYYMPLKEIAKWRPIK